MIDKTIVDREKSVRIVVSVVDMYAEEAAARLTELFTPVLAEGEQLPDWVLDQRLKVRLLLRLWEALKTSHDALERKRHQLRRVHRSLVDATDAVYDRILSLKRILQGLRPGGDKWLRGRLPREPDELVHGAKLALRTLGEMERQSTDKGEFDPEFWIEGLAPEEKTLDTTLQKKKLVEREVQGLEAERNRRLKEFGVGFVRLAGELQALYELAGLDQAARTIRPSRKYPGRTLAEIRRLGKA